MKNAVPDYSKQRSAFRLPVSANEPVYLLFSIEGENIDPLIDELGAGGARFASAHHYWEYYKGQMLGPAVLLLPDLGMLVVYPVVQWMSYPRIGVEFADIKRKTGKSFSASCSGANGRWFSWKRLPRSTTARSSDPQLSYPLSTLSSF